MTNNEIIGTTLTSLLVGIATFKITDCIYNQGRADSYTIMAATDYNSVMNELDCLEVYYKGMNKWERIYSRARRNEKMITKARTRIERNEEKYRK